MSENHFENSAKQIKETIESAINQQDFTNLSQSVNSMINKTIQQYKEAMGLNRAKNVELYPAPYELTNELLPEGKKYYVNNPSKGSIVLKLGLGIIALIVFAVLLLIFGILTAVGHPFMIPSIIFAAGAVFGLVLAALNSKNLKLVRHYEAYIKKIGRQTFVPLSILADAIRQPLTVVKSDLEKLIQNKLFYEAHTEVCSDEPYLILTDNAYRSVLDAKLKNLKKAEAAAPGVLDPETEQMLKEGDDFVRQIQACNELIPNPELTQKLDRLETIVNRILAEVKVHPEKAPDLKKMMNYYLPTAVKLTQAYIDLDRQPEAGKNISSSKEEIVRSIDVLNDAFENLFDNLFLSQTIDIKSDAAVLKTMLAHDGLTSSQMGESKTTN